MCNLPFSHRVSVECRLNHTDSANSKSTVVANVRILAFTITVSEKKNKHRLTNRQSKPINIVHNMLLSINTHQARTMYEIQSNPNLYLFNFGVSDCGCRCRCYCCCLWPITQQSTHNRLYTMSMAIYDCLRPHLICSYS